jgi:F420-non-reducing hydrogenase iron-sulfur subunit
MNNFEPKIVAFLCNWCSYAGADKAGSSRKPYHPYLNIIRVMCSGRLDPQFILKAFEEGADAVLVLGCHPGDCHYKEGNYKTMRRHIFLKKMLMELGVEKERLKLDSVSSSESDKFINIVAAMVEKIKTLGPFNAKKSDSAGRDI